MRPFDPVLCCKPLRGARIELWPTAPRHAPGMFAVLRDPRIYAFIEDEPPADADALARRYADAAPRCSPDGREGWFEWVALHEARPAGYVQATVRPALQETVLAYVLGPAFWGFGIATEGCRLVMAHLTAELGPHRFAIHVDTRNLASQRVAERLGFRRTDRLVGVNHIRGEVSDDYRYVFDP